MSFALPALDVRAAAQRGDERPRSLITLWLSGGPSQLETWDPHPGTKIGGPTKATGSVSLPIHISAKSKNPAIAAKFLNFLTTAQAANVILAKGDLPARPLSNPKVDPKSSIASIVAAWRKTSQSPNLVPYMDWPTPTMFDTLMGGVQSLMAGQKSPEDFAKTVQTDWAKYHKG